MSGGAIVSVLAACIALGAAAVGEKHRNELKEHYDHLAYIAEFPCHKPQPRVISVHKLFPDTDGKAYFPDVSVLHRCDEEAGCCTEGKSCLPIHTHPVDLPFKVTFLEQHGGHKRGSWIIEYYTVHNHTECACGHLDHYEDNQKHHHGTQDHRHQSPEHHQTPEHHQSTEHHQMPEHSVGSSSQGYGHHESAPPAKPSNPSYQGVQPPRPSTPLYNSEQKKTEVTAEAEEESEICEADLEPSEQSSGGATGQSPAPVEEISNNNVKREDSSTVSPDVADLLAAINT